MLRGAMQGIDTSFNNIIVVTCWDGESNCKVYSIQALEASRTLLYYRVIPTKTCSRGILVLVVHCQTPVAVYFMFCISSTTGGKRSWLNVAFIG